jgi:hypothetical protein
MPGRRSQTSSSLKVVENPDTEEQRHAVAKLCVDDLGLTLPTVVDGMDNSTNLAYGAWPDRLYVIGADGRVAWQGEPGPRGFEPDSLEAALKATLASTGSAPATPVTPVTPAAPEAPVPGEITEYPAGYGR